MEVLALLCARQVGGLQGSFLLYWPRLTASHPQTGPSQSRTRHSLSQPGLGYRTLLSTATALLPGAWAQHMLTCPLEHPWRWGVDGAWQPWGPREWPLSPADRTRVQVCVGSQDKPGVAGRFYL